MTTTPAFKNLDRYELVCHNADRGANNWSVLDTQTDQYLTGPEGTTVMDQRDAHDLREEYRWS